MAVKEEIVTNNIGTGSIEGAGIGPQGEPGKYIKKRKLNPVMATISRKRFKGFREFTNGRQK